LALGLWQGKTSKDARCYDLPDGLVDLSVWGQDAAPVTVWVQVTADKKHLRAEAHPVWTVSGIAGSAHQVCVSGQADTAWVAQVGLARDPTLAQEPDDGRDFAQDLPLGGVMSGTLDARGSVRDTDTYALPADTASHWLRLTAPVGQKIDYQLHNAAGTKIKAGRADNEINIQPFVATEDLVLSISGAVGAKYEVAYIPDPVALAGGEVEPNDTIETASIWDASGPIAGQLDADDTDFLRVDLDAPPQLWRVQADGEGVTRLTVYDVDDAVISERRGTGNELLRISNLYMIPGRYTVKVEGEGSYNLRLLPQGPRRDDVEMEPNHDAQALLIGQSLRGQLDPHDKDKFRFTVRATEWLTLRVSPPLGETISVDMLSEGGEVFRHLLTGGQSTLDYTRSYHAGDYEIQIATAGGISGLDDYTVALLPAAAPFGPPRDREPNDYAYLAENWPDDGRLVGRVGVVRQDQDAYRLGVISDGADLRFCGLPDAISITIVGPDGSDIRTRRSEKIDGQTCLIYDSLVSGDHIVFVEQNSAGSRTGNPTDYVIAPTGLAAGEQGAPLPRRDLGIKIETAPPMPKSFVIGFAQHLPFAFLIADYDRLAPLTVSILASDPNWSIGPLDIAEQGDGRALVTSTYIAPPDSGEREIRVHLKVENGSGHGVLSQVFLPDTKAKLLAPLRSYAVPDAMLGGLNMAATQFGGRIVGLDGRDLDGRDPEGARDTSALIDGLAIASEEFVFRHVESGPVFNFDLGGDEIVPLAGLLLTPRAAPGATYLMKDFVVEASTDGVTFSPVLRATLSADPIEQSFVFDPVVPARALRLVPLSNWSNFQRNNSPIKLGEFKAVASPGWMPHTQLPVNIADPTQGGQIVWADPAGTIDVDWDRSLLLGDDTRPSLIRNVDHMSVVVGFHHSRAAHLSGADWTLASKDLVADHAGEVDSMTFSTSTLSPLGPWTQFAQWNVASGAPKIDFPQPVWARYLRIDMSTQTSAKYLRIPEQLRVWEAASSVQQPSILGEWGEFSQASAYERDHEIAHLAPPAPTGGATAQQAVALQSGNIIASSVQRGVNTDWWRITSPAEPRELRVTLDTGQQGGATPALFDAAGGAVPVRRSTPKEAEDRGMAMPLYLAVLAANQSYNLRIEEPLRPIVIVWDTSGSTGPYKPAMQRALRDIALQADPDRDLIGFLPFGGSFLGTGLLGEPELLIRRLGTITQSGNSSNAEKALIEASEMLAGQDGVRGIILITDAATGHDAALWQSLNKVRPRIGALAIPSTGAFGPNPDRERDLMENWARVNGGFYQYISTQADFTEGFARAVDKMRGPKPYEMRISFGPVIAQPDGQLRVIETLAQRDVSAAPNTSLLILMDTSGSMLQRIDGKRRYQIAQAALAQLVKSADERGVAIGLRQFGVEPDACDSALLAPISRQDPAQMQSILDQILPRNNARTPIAAALAMAGNDLKNAQGAPRIVILTDGEETCDGDPKQAIQDLAEQGIAVRIDIVGFAIDDPALSATFADWAAAGGGQYVNASDQTALERALLDVSQNQFRAIAADGVAIAGQVSRDAVALPAGRYTLVIDGRDGETTIDIEPDTELVIELTK
jgi:Mg-chelatase subunit ChlD